MRAAVRPGSAGARRTRDPLATTLRCPARDMRPCAPRARAYGGEIVRYESGEAIGRGIETRPVPGGEPVEQEAAQRADVERRAHAAVLAREARLHHRLFGERQEISAHGLEESREAFRVLEGEAHHLEEEPEIGLPSWRGVPVPDVAEDFGH